MHDLIDILKMLLATVPVGLLIWKNRQSAIKETFKKHKENQDKADKQTELLGEINDKLTEHPPHSHREKNGPLQAENIRPDIKL